MSVPGKVQSNKTVQIVLAGIIGAFLTLLISSTTSEYKACFMSKPIVSDPGRRNPARDNGEPVAPGVVSTPISEG